jgi:hypothetical protein
MKKFFFLIGLFMIFAKAQNSLPWKGTIVFEDWVRVDDAPGTSGHPAYYPQTIMDDNLILYSVWADDRDNDDNYEIYFALSTDTAQTWTTPNINLSQSLLINDLYPWLCVDSTNLYVVWQSWRNGNWKIYLTTSSDGGTTWSTPDTVPGILVVNDFNSNINFGPQPKITVDSKSNTDTTFLYLLWADNATGLIQIKLARSIDLGQSFVDLGIVDNNLGNVNRNPYIVVDDSGWVHCAWARGTGGTNQDPHPWIGYNRSQDRGSTFLPNDLIVNDDSGGVYRGNPSLTYNTSNGNVLISWEDSRRAGGNANPDIWFSRIHRDSLSFMPNQKVNWWGADTSIRYDNFKSVIMMDPEGIMVAAWHDDPDTNIYGIHIAAYSDTIGRFSNSQSLINTFTGTSGASFGNDFYPPSLFVTLIDTVTNFFLVWQDYYEDSLGGNIYSVRGWVVESMADLDVDNDSLDVVNDTMNLRTQPAGPAYSPYARGAFILVNTDDLYNPDPEDGPSSSPVDSFSYSGVLSGPGGNIDSIFVLGLPSSMSVGQVSVCTLAVVIPVNMTEGTYTGLVTIEGHDSLGALVQESFAVTVQGPRPRGSLDSLRVVPIPFKPHSEPGHDAIHFQGLTDNATVRVYDLSGALVFGPETDNDGAGHLAWNAEVASGIYIYLVTTTDGEVKKGKLSVIR